MPPRRFLLPGFHPSAGTWAAAGNRFTKLRIMPPLPIGAYTGRISGVPLTGGQASGLIPGSTGSGSVNSPAAQQLITSVPVTAAGTYTVSWSVTLSGTLSPADAANMQLWQNSGGTFTLLATATNPAAPGTYVQAAQPVTAAAGDLIQVYSGLVTAPTAGAVYGASLSVPGGPLTLSVGPQGLGTTWYPAQVTLSTTTGALDTSTALVYLGIGGVPTMLVATVFSGNGTAAVAIPSMQPGEFIIVTWANGHVGDTASFNVIGTQDALTTGPPG